MRLPLLILVIQLLMSCSHDPEFPNSKQSISDRQKKATYQAIVPQNWVRIDPSLEEDLSDTTKPICSFRIGNDIRLTIHNFPTPTEKERIPPEAQIARWKGQIRELDLTSIRITPVAWGGYSGLFFSAKGETAVIGWALWLAPHHYRVLNSNQARSEVTIKATGPASEIDLHKDEIIAFAHSFELIEEIPRK